MSHNDSEYLIELSNNLENNKIVLRPFYHTDLKNTLENIVFKDKLEKDTNLLDKLFFDKSKTSKATVKALLEEITLRENLNIHLLNKINKDICRQDTHLMHLENIKVQYFQDWFIDIKKIKMQIEDKILELEKEKRKEYLECWRDLMFLKKYLLSAFKEYWDLIKKRDVLFCDVNELMKNENSPSFKN